MLAKYLLDARADIRSGVVQLGDRVFLRFAFDGHDVTVKGNRFVFVVAHEGWHSFVSLFAR
jgi:hypothetical protein